MKIVIFLIWKQEVLPLVEPAKELIDLVSEMAKKQLKELTL